MKNYKFILDSTELSLSPAGWDNLGQYYIRNEFYSSVSRSLVLNLRFPLKEGGGGLDILEAYNTDGINANMTFEIQERNPQTNDYDSIFNGILDFNPERISINYEDRYFEIGAIDGSKEQKFFTRDDIEFDINSLISADGDTMTDYGFTASVEFNPVNIYLNAFATALIDDDFTLTQASPVHTSEPEATYFSNIIGSRVSETNPIYTNDTGSSTEVTIDLEGSYNITYTNDGSAAQKSTTVNLYTNVYISIGTKIYTTRHLSLTISESGSPYSGSFTKADATPGYSWTVPDGGYITITMEFVRSTTSTFPLPQPTNDVDVVVNFNKLYIYEKSLGQDASDVDCYMIHDALVRLVQLMTSEDTAANTMYAEPFAYAGNPDFTYSAMGDHRPLALTTGWNLRQFPDKPFNISMRKLFKSIDSLCFLGLGYDRINDRFYVDYKSNFYTDTLMFDLGEVDEMIIKPSPDHYFNEILFGYGNEVEYEELQGANEFNVPCSHLLKVNVKKSADIKTEYNGDTIGMELSRRQPYDEYPQTDTRYDEQIFIIYSNISMFYQDPNMYAATGTNVTDGFQGSDEYYNTKYTPRENLKRWAKYINIPLWKNSTNETVFVKTQKNTFIEISSESELTGLTSSNLSSTPLFYPEYYEFKAPLTKSNIEQLNSDPHGVINFSFRNVDYAGHVIEVKSEGYKKMATWKLIRAIAVNKNYLFEDETLFKFEDGTQYEFE